MLKRQFYCQSAKLGISAYSLTFMTQVLLLLQRVAGILYALIIVYNIWLRTLNVDQHMKSSPLMLYLYYNKNLFSLFLNYVTTILQIVSCIFLHNYVDS